MADTERTQTEILALLADNTAGAISPQDLRDSVVSARANQGGGWANYLEGTAVTQGTAQSITAATRTQLLIDGLGFGSDAAQIQDMGTVWHDDYLDLDLNGAYNVRVAFKSQIATAGGGHYFTLELDDGARVIWSELNVLAKGAGIEHAHSFAIPMYVWPDLATNGGIFYLTSDVDIDVWSAGIFVARTYRPDN
jgi:hypothetical protein